MNHSFLLQGSRMQLLNQLVYFDDQKTDFLDQYYPSPTKDRMKIEQMLTTYSEKLEKILTDFNEESLNSTVLIGSQMKLYYVEDGYTENYTIVFPHLAEPNQNKISFLSPIGFQLLMGSMNDEYQLEVPSGKMEVRIDEIKYYNCGNANGE